MALLIIFFWLFASLFILGTWKKIIRKKKKLNYIYFLSKGKIKSDIRWVRWYRRLLNYRRIFNIYRGMDFKLFLNIPLETLSIYRRWHGGPLREAYKKIYKPYEFYKLLVLRAHPQEIFYKDIYRGGRVVGKLYRTFGFQHYLSKLTLYTWFLRFREKPMRSIDTWYYQKKYNQEAREFYRRSFSRERAELSAYFFKDNPRRGFNYVLLPDQYLEDQKMATTEERELADQIRKEIFDQVVVQYRIYQEALVYRKMSKSERAAKNYSPEREALIKAATKEILELKRKNRLKRKKQKIKKNY